MTIAERTVALERRGAALRAHIGAAPRSADLVELVEQLDELMLEARGIERAEKMWRESFFACFGEMRNGRYE